MHKKIILLDLTPCSPFDNLPPDSGTQTQNRSFTELLQHVEEKKKVVDARLPIQKLCDALILGARRGEKKGWYRKSL